MTGGELFRRGGEPGCLPTSCRWLGLGPDRDRLTSELVKVRRAKVTRWAVVKMLRQTPDRSDQAHLIHQIQTI